MSGEGTKNQHPMRLFRENVRVIFIFITKTWSTSFVCVLVCVGVCWCVLVCWSMCVLVG